MQATIVARCALRGIAEADIWALYSRVASLARPAGTSRGAVGPLLDRVRAAESAMADAAEVRNAADACAELRALADAEIASVSTNGAVDAAELITLLADNADGADEENDGEGETKGALLEVRAGAGGSEASLFVTDLVDMYERLAARHRWRVRRLVTSSTSVGGLREAVISVEGRQVYDRLRGEAGVHRVQRVPATESQGRVHTSTATVAVLRATTPRRDAITLDPATVRIDVYRASGAGGQHVNKTESAVRATHIPTGLVATSQEDRSQHRNRAIAMESLRTRVAAKLRADAAQKRASERRNQLGASSGERSDRIRTYNFPQNRVTDHRIVPNQQLTIIIPSAQNAIGEKSAPLAAVLRGEQELDRVMDSVAKVAELEKVRRLVLRAEQDLQSLGTGSG